MNPIFANLPTTVFEVMSQMARETGAINLGQGFPDDPGPLDVRAEGGRGRGLGLEPVSADDGSCPSCARRWPSTTNAITRALDLDWRTRR